MVSFSASFMATMFRIIIIILFHKATHFLHWKSIASDEINIKSGSNEIIENR